MDVNLLISLSATLEEAEIIASSKDYRWCPLSERNFLKYWWNGETQEITWQEAQDIRNKVMGLKKILKRIISFEKEY